MGPRSIISNRDFNGNDPGSLVQVKLLDSVQLQKVLASYDQETVRNIGQPSYSRLKTSVGLQIDQTMRTRNFRVRNEIMERGAVTKSQTGKNAYVERKLGECYRWKVKGRWSKGDSCRFRIDPASGNGCEAHGAKGQSLSPAPNSRDTLKTCRQQRRKPLRQKGQNPVPI